MSDALTPDQAAARINQALDEMQTQTPALAQVIGAFRGSIATQAAIKAGLPALDQPQPRPPSAHQTRGVPLAGVADFLLVDGLDLPRHLAQAVSRLLPELERGFPALAPAGAALRAALAAGDLDLAGALDALLGGDRTRLEKLCAQAGVDAPGFEFILLQAAKPFLERRAQALAGRLAKGEHGGSCPLCGSLPELSYIQGAAGERWLRCSLCATHWRFSRTTCPVCGNQDQEKMGFFFVEGREDQRVDHCSVCGKYLVGLDLRGKDREPVWEVVGMGMIHLDILAQQRGFSPTAALAWNRLA